MTTCLFLTLSLSVILVVVNSCTRLNKLQKKKEPHNKFEELRQQMDFIFSYIKILDAKIIFNFKG